MLKRVFIPILFLIAACHQRKQDETKSLTENQQTQVDSIAFVNDSNEGLKKQVQSDSTAALSKSAPNIQEREDTNANNDTTYKIGSFLICCYKGMKFDIINKRHPQKTKESKGDTLYNSKDTLILGDLRSLCVHSATGSICCGMDSAKEGVYKKYSFNYTFSQFKVDKIYVGKPAPPDFKGLSISSHYKMMIRQNGYANIDYAKENDKVNFAGHYTIIEWSKQGTTQFLAIVDRMNGKVYHKFPFGVFDWYFGGIEYYKDSRMLVLHPDLLDIYPGYCLLKDGCGYDGDSKPAVYVWNDSIFKRVE